MSRRVKQYITTIIIVGGCGVPMLIQEANSVSWGSSARQPTSRPLMGARTVSQKDIPRRRPPDDTSPPRAQEAPERRPWMTLKLAGIPSGATNRTIPMPAFTADGQPWAAAAPDSATVLALAPAVEETPLRAPDPTATPPTAPWAFPGRARAVRWLKKARTDPFRAAAIHSIICGPSPEDGGAMQWLAWTHPEDIISRLAHVKPQTMREFVSMAVNYGNTDEVATTARTIAITAEVRAAMSDVDVSGAVTRICVEIGLLPDWLEGKLGLVETAARHGMRIPLWWAGSPNAARMYTAARVTKGVNVGDGAIVQRSYGAIKERVARGGDVRVDYQETSEGWVILPQDLLQSPEPYMTQSPGPYMSDEEGRTPPACTSPFYRPESESDTSGTGSPYPY